MGGESRNIESALRCLRLREPALRYGLLKSLGKLLDGRLRENRSLVAQKVVRVHLVVEHQLDAFEITRAQHQRLRQGLAMFDDQGCALRIELVEGFAILFGLGFLDLERI